MVFRRKQTKQAVDLQVAAGLSDAPSSRPHLVVAVDPPQAWAIWGTDGLIACHEAPRIRVKRGMPTGSAVLTPLWTQLLSSERALARVLGGQLKADRYTCHVGVVERPYGTSSGNIQSLVTESLATGWWMRGLRNRTQQLWVPQPGQWRKQLGFGGAARDRALAKEAAIALARRLAGGERGEHESEAIAMCVAAWIRYGLREKGDAVEIGRASCRERVWISVVGGS